MERDDSKLHHPRRANAFVLTVETIGMKVQRVLMLSVEDDTSQPEEYQPERILRGDSQRMEPSGVFRRKMISSGTFTG